ncbi:hypothetical protein MBLNU13_g03198t1 [Cladosporium sp. NU13]
MPRLTLKNIDGSYKVPTNTNASNGAPPSTNLDNPACKIRKDSARPRLILHLNAKQRKEAEAAARSLRRATASLESYRQSLDGHAAPESKITQPLTDTAWAAIDTFNRIAHPGGRAREIFALAMHAFDEMRRLMISDIQKQLDCETSRQGVEEAA